MNLKEVYMLKNGPKKRLLKQLYVLRFILRLYSLHNCPVFKPALLADVSRPRGFCFGRTAYLHDEYEKGIRFGSRSSSALVRCKQAYG